MHTEHQPTSAWTAPRLVALGASRDSKNGDTNYYLEDGNYRPVSIG